MVLKTCPECGCSLKEFDNWGYKEYTHYTLPHDVINGHAERDAKSHTCKYLNASFIQYGNELRWVPTSYTMPQFRA